MDQTDQFLELARRCILLAFMLSAPFVLSSVILGLFVALLQTLTQLQEQSLGFFAKVLAVFLILLMFGSSIGASLLEFTEACLVVLRP